MDISRPASITCPLCGRNVLVNPSGYARRHRTAIARGSSVCPGSDVEVTHEWPWIESERAPMTTKGT